MIKAISGAIASSYDEFRRWELWFPAAMVIIAAVSVYDTYMIVRFADIMSVTELNPLGRWLIEIADGQVGVFVRVKLAGTLCVLAILMFMKLRRVQGLFTVTTSIASCQTGLIIFLTVI